VSGGHADSTLAKLTAPPARGVVPRKRLFRHLDGITGGGTAWIQGPPGAGKTALVSSYLEDARPLSVWYHMEAQDGDPATFFYYLGLAARQARPRSRKAIPLFTPEHQGNLAEFTNRFVEAMFATLKGPCVLIFDDYQEVPEASPVHEVVGNLCQSAPRRARVIVTSRASPPPALARLVANGVIRALGWEDLRLSRSEVQAIVRLRNGSSSRKTVESLAELTRGWAAGLVLLLAHPSAPPGLARVMTDSDPAVIADYFANELLGRTDPRTRRILLETALLPTMSAAMAVKMTGDVEAPGILDDLYSRGYFTERFRDSEAVYRYHPVVPGGFSARNSSKLSTPRRNARCATGPPEFWRPRGSSTTPSLCC